MLTKFSGDLKIQEVYAEGGDLTAIMGKREVGANILVHTFIDPVLVTDNYRIGLLSPNLRDTLFSLYSRWPRTVEYDSVAVTWDNNVHHGVWGPSIDTLVIAKALKKIFSQNNKIYSAIEVGCGSGFLSKYILTKNTELQSMVINDMNPLAIECARDNIKDSRAEFRIGLGQDALASKKYDLIVCNPPYIPRPDSIENNPYEGISLLWHLVHDGAKYLNPGGSIVIGLSNLADKIVFSTQPGLEFKTIEEMDVPLKVNNVQNNAEWLEYLQDRNLTKDNHGGYEFWHRIKTIWAEKPSS